MLIEAGARPDPEAGRDSALECAALQGRLDMVRLLLDSGASPNHRGSNSGTPLISGVRSGQHDVIRALILAGADVNAESVDGVSVLDRAIEQNDSAIVDILLQAGATRRTK